MEILGINWKILVAQIINFIILFWLLKRFAFRPFLAVLKKRQSDIEEGVKKGELAEKSLLEIRSLSKEIKEKGAKEAKELLKDAILKASREREKIIFAAEDAKIKIIEKAKESAEKEIFARKREEEQKTINAAFFLAEKILKEKMNKEKDKRLIKELLASLRLGR